MLSSILTLIAGFGVFVFGLQTFSKTVEKLLSNKFRKGINNLSKNRFAALGTGFLFTSLMQSSTAGILLIAGFTSAGILTLFQGLALTLGSSMASAVPNFLISVSSFNIKEIFYALAGVGAIISAFSKRSLARNIGTAIIGFALIFIGMGMMGTGTSVFSSDPAFTTFFQTLTNPILLILIGLAFTIITQSSLATVAVLMTLVGTSTITGAMSVESAAYVVYGANIGSSITTALLTSFSSNIDGKRIALFHIIYLTIGAIAFSLISLTPWIDALFGWVSAPTLRLAFVNLFFNVVVSLFMLPLLNPSVKLMRKILPGKKNKNPLAVDEISNESPAVSLAKANEKTIVFFDAILPLYKKTIIFVEEKDGIGYRSLLRRLSSYGSHIEKLTSYIIRITTTEVYESLNKEAETLLNTIKQLERINNNCIKILHLINNNGKKINFSLKLKKFTNNITKNLDKMFDLTKNFILDPSCSFLHKEEPATNYYNQIVEMSQENSATKLAAKTYVIETGFHTKNSTEKNTSYMELVSYLGLISNNILDIIFGIMGNANVSTKKKYEQLILENFE